MCFPLQRSASPTGKPPPAVEQHSANVHKAGKAAVAAFGYRTKDKYRWPVPLDPESLLSLEAIFRINLVLFSLLQLGSHHYLARNSWDLLPQVAVNLYLWGTLRSLPNSYCVLGHHHCFRAFWKKFFLPPTFSWLLWIPTFNFRYTRWKETWMNTDNPIHPQGLTKAG